MMRRVFTAAMAMSLGGCTWFGGWFAGSENLQPPTELTQIEQEIEPRRLWSVDVGAGGEDKALALRPAIGEGMAFIAGAGGTVVAVDLTTGERRWRADTGVPVSGGPGYGDGLVLLGTPEAQVVALRAKDGSRVWEARVTSEVLSVPQAQDGVVTVRSVDDRLTALSSADGTRMWTYSQSSPALSLRGTSSPVMVGSSVICGFDNGRLAALTAQDGKLVWEQRVAVPRGRSELERIVDVDATPHVQDTSIYAASYQGRVAALDARTGRVDWSKDLSVYSGLVVDSGHVYVADESSQVWALDNRTGASFWKQDKLKWRWTTGPVTIDSYVVVGDFEGYLHWMAAEDGHLVARARAGRTPLTAAPVVQGATLLAQTRGGKVTAYTIAPE